MFVALSNVTKHTLIRIADYMPVYFQACKGASPIHSGVLSLPYALVVAPIGIFAGVSVKKSGHYRPQIWTAWIIMTLGVGILAILHADSSAGLGSGLTTIVAAGIGIIATTTYFPVLAPRMCALPKHAKLVAEISSVPVSQNAYALAYFMFLRNFAQVRRALALPYPR
jgi:hypothetical protein